MVKDGRIRFQVPLDGYIAGLLTRLAFHAEVTIPPTSRVSGAEPLPAFVLADRWVAMCRGTGQGPGHPADVQFVWLDLPLMLCTYCWNRPIGGDWRRVALPPDEERLAIEAALAVRVDPNDRNWEPGQTAAELLAANIAGGPAFARETA